MTCWIPAYAGMTIPYSFNADFDVSWGSGRNATLRGSIDAINVAVELHGAVKAAMKRRGDGVFDNAFG